MIGRLKFKLDTIVDSILEKIPDEIWSNPNSKFLDIAMGGGQFVVAIENKLREYGYSDKNIRSRVFGLESNKLRVQFAINKNNLVGTYTCTDFLTWKTNMKFDVIIGNPPYQTQVGPKKTEPIWDKFVEKSFSILNEDGYLSLIHPSGWRNVDGRFTKVRDLLLSKKMEYLEIHNVEDGIKTFGAETRYDWYVVKNTPNRNYKTKVLFEDGTSNKINLTDLPFIPNHSYEKVRSLVAEPGQEMVDVIYSRSAYGTDKKHISMKKTKNFKYPVVYVVRKNGDIEFCYSSTNQNGHYGIPKIIWSNTRISSVGTFLDVNGDYAINQFNFAIADTPSNLKKIQKAFESDEFVSIMEAVSQRSVGINHLALSTFRKDFWKEFV